MSKSGWTVLYKGKPIQANSLTVAISILESIACDTIDPSALKSQVKQYFIDFPPTIGTKKKK